MVKVLSEQQFMVGKVSCSSDKLNCRDDINGFFDGRFYPVDELLPFVMTGAFGTQGHMDGIVLTHGDAFGVSDKSE